ncbi:MAG TPA: hypothetical protein VMG99_08860 [Thermoplasmata archaeon]|nr:hypothetical protein [Thermoplasmata archaeon]
MTDVHAQQLAELEAALEGRDATIENLRTVLEEKQRALYAAQERVRFLEAQLEDPDPADAPPSA